MASAASPVAVAMLRGSRRRTSGPTSATRLTTAMPPTCARPDAAREPARCRARGRGRRARAPSPWTRGRAGRRPAGRSASKETCRIDRAQPLERQSRRPAGGGTGGRSEGQPRATPPGRRNGTMPGSTSLERQRRPERVNRVMRRRMRILLTLPQPAMAFLGGDAGRCECVLAHVDPGSGSRRKGTPP